MSDRSAAELREMAARYIALANDKERREAEEARRALEASKPRCPELVPGQSAILWFSKYMSGKDYVYAAVVWKQGGSEPRVAVSSTLDRGGHRFNWAGFLNFVGPANWTTIRRVTESTPLITSEPPVAERMGDYGKVLGHEIVEPYLGRAGHVGDGPY